MHSPVDNHDLVPPLQNNPVGQAHSRMPECDGGLTFQVKPYSIDRVVPPPTGFQTNLPKVVHSSCRPVCHSSEPQAPAVCISSPRPTCLGHRCPEYKLVGSCGLCIPSYGSPSQGGPKDQAVQLPCHTNSPRLARDVLVLGPSAALNGDPTSATSVQNTTQTASQSGVSQQPSIYVNLHVWCLGVLTSPRTRLLC